MKLIEDQERTLISIEPGLTEAWAAAVIAVVDACDAELEYGAKDDFERGADAAYNWVLSVIPSDVLAAARAALRSHTDG